ncbi:DUF3363 domain-containing protein [Methylobacillus arboreus]
MRGVPAHGNLLPHPLRIERLRHRALATHGAASLHAEGEQKTRSVSGIYRRSIILTSGRYAMLDEGMGFSLVPWKPVIEQRLGQQVAATMRGGGVSWEIGRQHGLPFG